MGQPACPVNSPTSFCAGATAPSIAAAAAPLSCYEGIVDTANGRQLDAVVPYVAFSAVTGFSYAYCGAGTFVCGNASALCKRPSGQYLPSGTVARVYRGFSRCGFAFAA